MASVDQLRRNRGHRFVPLPREVQILDLRGRLFEAETLGIAVVEVLVPRAHATDVQRHLSANRHHALFHIIPHDDGHEGCHVELAHVLVTRFGETFLDRLVEYVKLFRVHPHREKPIGDFGCSLDTLGGNRCGIDRNIFLAVQNTLERFAETRCALAGVG